MGDEQGAAGVCAVAGVDVDGLSEEVIGNRWGVEEGVGFLSTGDTDRHVYGKCTQQQIEVGVSRVGVRVTEQPLLCGRSNLMGK